MPVTSCGDCMFADRRDRKGPAGTEVVTLLCRRGPPQIVGEFTSTMGDHPGEWPEVQFEDWCGEGRAKL